MKRRISPSACVIEIVHECDVVSESVERGGEVGPLLQVARRRAASHGVRLREARRLEHSWHQQDLGNKLWVVMQNEEPEQHKNV